MRMLKSPPPVPGTGMIFTDPRGTEAAAERARRFAGPNGRLATLPDLVDARLNAGLGDPAWTTDVVTDSAEYVGLSEAGTPVIAVAHGLGPLADPESLSGDGPAIDAEGRVGREDFLNLLRGFYGDVTVLDLNAVLRRRRFPFLEALTFEEAVDDPLVRARLGPRAGEFLAHHLRLSQDWLRERDRGAIFNRCVLSQRDAACFNYHLAVDAAADRPVGHRLHISQAFACEHGHWNGQAHESLITEIGCAGPRDAAQKFVGVRGRARLRRIHPGESLVLDGMARHWRRLLVCDWPRPDPFRMHNLVRYGDQWFSQHRREDVGRDTGEPELMVRIIERTGLSRDMKVRVRNGCRELLYDPAWIAREAVPWANAYHIASEPRTIWEGDDPAWVEVRVDFYRVAVQPGFSIPPLAEMRDDVALLLSLPVETACQP